MAKTNAVRILEASSISFEAIEYSSSDDEIDAVSVAHKIGADPEQVFKTLVARGDRYGEAVFVVPGPYELDPKKAASVSGNKRIELIKVKELLPLTGYIRGGCSPIGMKKQFPTYIDETAMVFDRIYVSAGVRGMQLFLSPADLLRQLDASFADLLKV